MIALKKEQGLVKHGASTIRKLEGINQHYLKVGRDEIRHVPRTHKPVTRNINNIELNENPQKDDNRKSYIVAKVQKTNPKYLGKKHLNEDIKNPVDKSIIRHLKKQDKKKS